MSHDLIVFTNWLADVVVVVGGIPWAAIGWIVVFGLGSLIYRVLSD